MVRRYPCQMVLLFACGILAVKGAFLWKEGIGTLGLWIAAIAAAAAFAAFVLWVYQQPSLKKRLKHATLLFAAAFSGAARMYVVSSEASWRLAGITDGQKAAIQGQVTNKKSKEMQNFAGQTIVQWTVYLTDSYLKTPQGIRPCGDVIVSGNLNGIEPVIGNTIVVSGKIKLFSTARNDGNFDERAYYQNQGYSFRFYTQDGTYRTADGQTDRLRESLYRLQQKLAQVYRQGMEQDTAGALGAMLLGEKAMLLQETKDLYQRSGIAHILAISGLHISILGAAVFGLLRKTGLPNIVAAAFSMSLLVLFSLMAGMGVSTVRAVAMFGIYLGAVCCGRAYDSVNGLAAAAAFILAGNPRALFLAGFQFSFAAVAGVLFGKGLCQIFRPRLRLSEAMITSFGIQVLTLPLTAWYYFELPAYAMLLNLLVLPFMALVLAAGLAGGVLGALSSIGACNGIAAAGVLGTASSIVAYLSKGLLGACSLLLTYFSKAGELFLKLPGAVYTIGKPHAWQMAGYALSLGVCIRAGYMAWMRSKSPSDMPGELRKKQKRAAIAGCMVSLALLFLRLPKHAEVSILDVGQGDGIYIRTGDGMHVLIDGGSSDVSSVGVYRIAPFLRSQGVSAIDCWFVSHLDKDHTSGLWELLESGFTVRKVVFAQGVLRDGAFEALARSLSNRQVETAFLEKGDVLCTEKARFTCLGPESGQTGNDRNSRSLVLLYEEEGFRGFFPGDISKQEEEKIELPYPNVEGFTALYKAAHHGSNYSNSIEVIKKLNPLVCVVSCAQENDYGHPGKDAVRNMEENSQQVHYTMQEGRIRVHWHSGAVNIQGFLSR